MKDIRKNKSLEIRLLQPSAAKHTYQLTESEDVDGEPLGSITWEKAGVRLPQQTPRVEDGLSSVKDFCDP
jgi:hypothetical protein